MAAVIDPAPAPVATPVTAPVAAPGSAASRPATAGPLAWLLGHDTRTRRNVAYTLLAFLMYGLWMGIEAYMAATGRVSWSAVAWMYAWNLCGLIGFYGLLRSGLSRHFADPSLTLAQQLYAVLALVIAYVLFPPTRAAVLQSLCLTQAFGMFALAPRQAWVSCVFSIGALLLMAVGLLTVAPAGFDAQRELIGIACCCVVLPALTTITHHFAQLRAGLQAQRAELKQALARVEQLATRDVLTGLTNRAHMLQVMDAEAKRHQRSGAPLSVVLMDLDHFKQINDSHGHQVGDEVLVGFAGQATEVLRQTDTLARWGGEEFLALLPETSAPHAVQAAERLREALARARLSTLEPELAVTVSCGVAEWRPGETLMQTLGRADRALYQAKHAGRNRSALAV